VGGISFIVVELWVEKRRKIFGTTVYQSGLVSKDHPILRIKVMVTGTGQFFETSK
jgi:hypothetical protein